VMAASSPAECFDVAIEAARYAIKYMTPVILLTDGYIANGEEPWAIPDMSKLPKIEVNHPSSPNSDHGFMPYKRDANLIRPWALPGTPGLEHRVGGLEKADVTGMVSYDPENHQKMIQLRAAKIAGIAKELPKQTVLGPEKGDLLVVGWGGTGGAIRSAVERVQQQGGSVAWAQVRYLNPFPTNLGDVLRNYRKILVPEWNLGQLRYVLRAVYGVDAVGLNKVKGRPFLISEIEAKINELLADGRSR
jgi:2-oxoglutarate/2-oxoacid ferredoxin oxidoreductase subunit alpha